MGLIRDSFVIFKNWTEAINTLPEEFQLECYKALAAYGTTGEIPQDISAVSKAMLVSFSVGMENSICKYNASVENGKKGGNPNFKKGQPNPYYAKDVEKITEDNSNITEITQDNLDITKDNQTLPTHNLNVNVNVNDNVNVSSLSRNSAGAREEDVDNSEEQRDFWKQHFNDFWKYNAVTQDLKDIGWETTDVIIDALRQANSEERLTYNRHKYDYGALFQLFNGLDSEDFGKIVWSVNYAEIKQNRQLYILGALLNKANEKKLAEERKHSLPEIGR